MQKMRSLSNFHLSFAFQVWVCIQNLYILFFFFCVGEGVVINTIIGTFSSTVVLST